MRLRVRRRAVEAGGFTRWEKQLTIGIELMVLDRQFDLVFLGGKIESGPRYTGVIPITD